jgi:ABC-type uncharacterized transport system ATPase subunit
MMVFPKQASCRPQMRLKFREVTAFADAVTVLTRAKHVGGGKVVERVTALLLHHVTSASMS